MEQQKQYFGSAMHFDLSDNKIPILTTKKVSWKTCLKELLWFIKGQLALKNARAKCKNMECNATREFLDSRGLIILKRISRTVYGHQWRFFNAEYETCMHNYNGKGVDQLQNVINLLEIQKHEVQKNYYECMESLSIEQTLPPGHAMCQFNAIGDKLSCSMYQRSGDVGLGVFNLLLQFLNSLACSSLY